MTDAGPDTVYRGSLDKLMANVARVRGVDLTCYRRTYVERRIAARLRVLDIHSYRQYVDILNNDPLEYERLIDTLTINVTDFFRDQVVWNSLKKHVMRPMIESKANGRSRTFRLWSAGCATGEEPYSLAMLLLDMLGPQASRYLITVQATDLDPDVLARAERGVYDIDKKKGIPATYQTRFTRPIDASTFEIAPEVRRLVTFSQANLFEPAPQRVVDLIVCRNVFIYFDREQQARALQMFQQALARGGYLVLGRSEKLSPEAASLLESIDGKERIYRKPVRN